MPEVFLISCFYPTDNSAVLQGTLVGGVYILDMELSPRSPSFNFILSFCAPYLMWILLVFRVHGDKVWSHGLYYGPHLLVHGLFRNQLFVRVCIS
jgi:hypothetical protein